MGRKKKRKKQRAARERAAAAAEAAPAPPEGPSTGGDSAAAFVEEPPEAAATRPPVHDPVAPLVGSPSPAEPVPAASHEASTAEASTPSSPGPADEPPPAVDLDADLDADDDADYHSLLALVTNMPDESAPTTRAGKASPKRRSDDDDDEVAVVDLDDDGSVEAVDRLIAKAVVGAPPAEVEEDEPEAPLIDLDADEPATPARARPTGTPSTASVEAARLAAAAARGAVEESDVPTFYLDEGGMSTPEARARLLAEALAHAEHKEATYRVPLGTGAVRRWKGAVAAVVFVLAGWVAVAPPNWVRPTPPAELTPAARARAVRTALYLQAQQVEAFRVRTQSLPASLEELPSRVPGIGYARAGNRAYQLIGYGAGGEAIIYDSVDPAPPFRALMSGWLASEGAP